MAEPLEERVTRAAEAAFSDKKYVGLIDVLLYAGFLHTAHIGYWQRGVCRYLAEEMQVGEKKLAQTVRIFIQWAEAKGLKASEARYTRHSREGLVDLAVFPDPEQDRMFRLRFAAGDLPPAEEKKVRQKAEAPPERVVFEITRDSACSECGTELWKGSFLSMDGQQALCLACGGLGDLEFLPAGDAALSRRSKKYSAKYAVVVKFSRSRGRYERQGLLVEEAALTRAEEECAEDAESRASARARSAERRGRDGRKLVEHMTVRIRELFPGCPEKEAKAIAAHTAVRGSGRVGRSAEGRALDDKALILAVRAAVRHRHTGYDELLAGGVEREAARERVGGKIDAVLEAWR